MTLAECILLIALGVGVYLLLTPLQRWLERRLLRGTRGRVYSFKKEKNHDL